jgi:hypothetical protein
MKTYVSLRVYWVLLCAFFTSLALVFLGLVSYGILEYNLGVNLFTSSISTVLTIVFLNFLFTSREQNEWKTVKDEVYSMIQMELGAMFNDILNYVEDGLITKSYLLNLKKKETRKEAFLSALTELKDAKELKLNDAEWKLMIENKTSLIAFSTAAQTLNEVEIKYSRFLSSQLTLSLIKIQNSIRMLDTLTQLHTSMKGLSPTLRPILLPAYQEMEKEIPKILSHSFKKILEEIYSMHKMGIEFSPYPI